MTGNEGTALPSAIRPGHGPDLPREAEMSEVGEEQNGGRGAGLGGITAALGLVLIPIPIPILVPVPIPIPVPVPPPQGRKGQSRHRALAGAGPGWGGVRAVTAPGAARCARPRAPQLRPARPERQQQVGPAARRGQRGILRPGVRGGSWAHRGAVGPGGRRQLRARGCRGEAGRGVGRAATLRVRSSVGSHGCP